MRVFVSMDYPPFCEARSLGGYPEVFSCISALFIAGTGVSQFSWTHDVPVVHAVSALMVANSVSSFAMHATGSNVAHFVDAMTMLLAVHLVCADAWANSSRRPPSRARVAAAWCTNTLLFWAQVAGQLAGVGRGPFVAGFALTFAAVLGMFWHVASRRGGRGDAGALRTGTKLCAYGVGVWVATESLCDAVPGVSMLHGHAQWHLCMALGVTCVSAYHASWRASQRPVSASVAWGGHAAGNVWREQTSTGR